MVKKIFILIFIVSFSLPTFSQQDEDINIFSIEAMEVLSRGLNVHEKLFDFFLDHPCELGIKKDCDRPMPSGSIGKMKNLLLELEEWRVSGFEELSYRANVLRGLPVALHQGEKLSVETKRRLRPGTLRSENYLKITYNPKHLESRAFVQKERIHVAINLLLLDSFFRLSDMLSKAKKIRAILQFDMPEVGPVLNKTYGMAMNKERWEGIRQSIQFLDDESKLRLPHDQTSEEGFFQQYIQKSFIAERMRENDLYYRLITGLSMERQLSETKFYETLNRVVGSLSKIFGNTAGKFQSRDGKLKVFAQDAQLMKKMKSELKPLDVFLEKTPFRLTDRFIPGYYGHVAIWLGSPEELSEMTVVYKGETISLLSHPDVLPHLEKLSQGKMIVEALREPGVTLNTFEHFLDIDDLLILRRGDLDSRLAGEYVLKTIRQVGKLYDFNFDIETEREIVCSELVYVVFNDQEWPIEREFGRYTISPDHVAWKGATSYYETIMMYVDGKKIEKEQSIPALRNLLDLPGGIADMVNFKKYAY